MCSLAAFKTAGTALFLIICIKERGKAMKACAISRFGGNEVIQYLEDIAVPEPGQEGILVKNRYAAVNPVDWKIREGYFPLLLDGHLPLVLGRDFCGEIVQVGAHVTDYEVGDVVCGYIPFDDGRAGTFAEYVCVSQELSCKICPNVSEATAACLPLIGLTAWQGIFEQIKLQKDNHILVLGGTTSVGSIAIQLGKIQNAQVLATAKKENFAYLHSLGVSHCIDYQTKNFASIPSDSLDAVYDCVGSEEDLAKVIDLVKQGGKIVSICIFSFPQYLLDQANAKNIDLKCYMLHPDQTQLQTMMSWISQGKLIMRPIELLKFSEIAQALAKSQSQHAQQKMVVKIND
jgi:NADPH:quinone reductase-like Zn-dependent oxidoreductase